MGARWYDPTAGDFTSADTVQVNPEPNPAAGNPFAYAADQPLDLGDPSGHITVDLPGEDPDPEAAAAVISTSQMVAERTGTAQAAAANAANLQKVAQQTGTSTAKAAAAAAVSYAQTTASNLAVAKTAEAAAAQAENAAEAKPVAISPHIYVPAGDPQRADLEAGYQWATNYLRSVGGSTDEYDIWKIACNYSPERDACNGVLGSYLGVHDSLATKPRAWNYGFGGLISPTGVAAIVLRGTPAYAASLMDLMRTLYSKRWDTKTAGVIYDVTVVNGPLKYYEDAVKFSEEKGEFEAIKQWLLDQGVPVNMSAAAAHPETQFAWWMRQAGVKWARIAIWTQSKTGVCPACRIAIPKILPGATADEPASSIQIDVKISGVDGIVTLPIDGEGPPVEGPA